MSGLNARCLPIVAQTLVVD